MKYFVLLSNLNVLCKLICYVDTYQYSYLLVSFVLLYMYIVNGMDYMYII